MSLDYYERGKEEILAGAELAPAGPDSTEVAKTLDVSTSAAGKPGTTPFVDLRAFIVPDRGCCPLPRSPLLGVWSLRSNFGFNVVRECQT